MNAIELIEQQQKKLGRCMAYGVGEQLKEICRSEPASAALLENDLDKKGMGIADVEKKIRAFAGKNGGFANKQEADSILREFYGLPAADAAPQPEPVGGSGNIIDLMDLL